MRRKNYREEDDLPKVRDVWPDRLSIVFVSKKGCLSKLTRAAFFLHCGLYLHCDSGSNFNDSLICRGE